ncbi:hypothetical protein AusDCA_2854 [Desulfitobacterium sp. AusDCA]
MITRVFQHNVTPVISNLLRTLGTYLKSHGLKIVQGILSFAFIYESLIIAIIGLKRLIPILLQENFTNTSSSLLAFWFILANFYSIIIWVSCYLDNRPQNYIQILNTTLFFLLLAGLGYLGLEIKYLYFLGSYLGLSMLIRSFPWFYRHFNAFHFANKP